MKNLQEMRQVRKVPFWVAFRWLIVSLFEGPQAAERYIREEDLGVGMFRWVDVRIRKFDSPAAGLALVRSEISTKFKVVPNPGNRTDIVEYRVKSSSEKRVREVLDSAGIPVLQMQSRIGPDT